MVLYHIWAVAKVLLGILILRMVYVYIDPTLDPAMWLWFWFLWIFITAWWSSFYLFFAIQSLISSKDTIRLAKESYKLSLLFGIFILINISLLFLEQRTKLLWAVLFLLFVGLQVFLAVAPHAQDYKKEF